MNTVQKISILADSAKYDTCASSASSRKIKTNDRIGNVAAGGICHSFTQDGRCISLYKTLYSNSCSFDCKYCTNSTGCNKRRATYKPEELAKVFMALYIRNYVEGLFLSSAVVRDPDFTTQRMIDTVRILREKYKFMGYIHFKIIPGTSYELIKQATEFSDRLSVNLEAPNKSRLSEISDVKDFHIDILRRQRWIKNMKIPSGQTTQLVVGASDETDNELLKMVNWEYDNFNLKRGYYSAFLPVPNTPLETKNKTPLLREHRLYNVDFMIRKYGIPLKDFTSIMDNGMLPGCDPKVALAEQTLDGPVDVNESSFDDLIRVPGIGQLSAKRIMGFRKSQMIKKYEQLHNIGVVLKRAKPFIKVNGVCQKRLGDFCA